MAQHTINLPCIADTWCELYTNVNNGASTSLKFGTYSMPSSVALLKFDHSLIPSGKRLVNATLKIYNLIARTPYSYGRIYYSAKVQDWQENVLTGATLGSTLYGGTYSFTNLPANNYVNIDITDLNMTANLMGIINGIHLDCYGVSTDTANNYISIASRETANPPILQITYEDVPPDKPILKYPDSQYIDSTTVIRFDWDYVSSAGDNQQKYDLQYKTIASETWTTVTQTTANTYYDMPGNVLPSGAIMWRVQTYNGYNEASGYSDSLNFYSIGAPPVPTINDVTEDTAKPTISWTATQQEVYQVQVLKDTLLLYDTGIKSIKEYTHKINMFLPDDSYTVRVRVQNEYSLWSTWAERLVNISTVKPTMPVITLQLVRNGVEADITNTVEVEYFLLMRNDVPVYKSIAAPLYDYAAENGKEYQYKVRAVSSNDTYIDSEAILSTTQVFGNVFASADSLQDMLEFEYNIKQQPDKNYKVSNVTNQIYVSGRKYAIVEVSGHMEKSMSFSFFTEEVNKVIELTSLIENGSIVIFRDDKGQKIFGKLTGFNSSEINSWYQVAFAINAVDYVEGIYD